MRFDFETKLNFSDEDKQNFPWLKASPRFYETLEPRVSGAHGSTYKARVVDAEGQPREGMPSVAIKVPNPEHDDDFSEESVTQRINMLNQYNVNELMLIRKKLEGCKHANPIFDLDILLENDTQNIITRTAQLYIRHGMKLKEWLVEQKLRAILDPAAEKEHFHGIATWKGWRRTALIIARALEDIHGRRVIHGDVWPDNIFISSASDLFSDNPQEVEPYAVLIDFQTAFLSMPSGDAKEQNNILTLPLSMARRFTYLPSR